jgi:hypothetical protein
MDIPEETIQQWQNIWQNICDMSYHRKDIVDSIRISMCDYQTLLEYSHFSRNFEQITLEHTWKKTSSLLDSNGTYIETQIVPELTKIYVPKLLFETFGVYAWFKQSFPNCSIEFWEDGLFE